MHMSEYQSNKNRKNANHGGRKSLTVAVSVVVAAVVVIAAFFLTKNTVFCSVARAQAGKGDFAAAEAGFQHGCGSAHAA